MNITDPNLKKLPDKILLGGSWCYYECLYFRLANVLYTPVTYIWDIIGIRGVIVAAKEK